MAINYNGQTYNEDWHPIDAMGNVLGDKDWAANAAWAAETGGQNPYTNAPGASPYDLTGMIPGNEPGSTLPPVGPQAPAPPPTPPPTPPPVHQAPQQPPPGGWPTAPPAPPAPPGFTPHPPEGPVRRSARFDASIQGHDDQPLLPRRGPTRRSDTFDPTAAQTEDDRLSELARLLQGIVR